jgi:hypothetical protein
MRCKRSCRLNAQARRDAGHEDSFTLQIHAGQNFVCCRSRSKYIHHIHIPSPSGGSSGLGPEIGVDKPPHL